jgi:hypothetical protein
MNYKKPLKYRALPGAAEGRSTGATISLAEGEQIQAVLIVREKSYSSSIFRP